MDDRAKCICWADLEPAHFKALDIHFKVVDIVALSCPTSGCQGNIAQAWTKILKQIEEDLKNG